MPQPCGIRSLPQKPCILISADKAMKNLLRIQGILLRKILKQKIYSRFNWQRCGRQMKRAEWSDLFPNNKRLRPNKHSYLSKCHGVNRHARLRQDWSTTTIPLSDECRLLVYEEINGVSFFLPFAQWPFHTDVTFSAGRGIFISTTKSIE